MGGTFFWDTGSLRGQFDSDHEISFFVNLTVPLGGAGRGGGWVGGGRGGG